LGPAILSGHLLFTEIGGGSVSLQSLEEVELSRVV